MLLQQEDVAYLLDSCSFLVVEAFLEVEVAIHQKTAYLTLEVPQQPAPTRVAVGQGLGP